MPTEPLLNNADTYGLNHHPSPPAGAPPNLSTQISPPSKAKPFLFIFLFILIISLATLVILKLQPSPTIRSTSNPFDIIEAQASITNPFATLR